MADVSKINGYNIKDQTARADIAAIKDGTTVVPKANFATNTAGAQSASDYDTTGGTIKVKFDEHDSAISSATTAANEAKTTAGEAKSLASDAKSIAEGRAKASVFDTVDAMTAALKAAAKSDYKIGDNLFIKATGVPDYWVSAVLESNTGVYGYFEVSELESKVDLTDYPTKEDLTSGDIKVKAAETADNATVAEKYLSGSTPITINTKFGTVDGEIAKIKDGTTVVGRASFATNAAGAQSASDYDPAGGTIKTKFDSVEGKADQALARDLILNYNAENEELTISLG